MSRRIISTTAEYLAARAGDTDAAATANPTIAPYHTNLNGVNQPVNLLFVDMLWWTLGIFGFMVLVVRILELGWSKLRKVGAMSVPGDKQTYWKYSQWSWMPGFKKHLLYAPFWKKRNCREFRIGPLKMGTLPTRFHSLILLILICSNIVYMFVLNWSNENKYAFCAELRGRSGTLSAVNMLPLIIFAGRNNPLIHLLKIDFSTYNLFHRWIGRIAVIEAVIHTISWAIVCHADGGWEMINKKIMYDRFITSGVVGTIAMVLLLLFSFAAFRSAFYETFLNVHIILAFVIFVGTYIHCIAANVPGVGTLPQLPIVIAIFSLWFADRLARMIRMIYYNWSSRGQTEAFVEAMPGEAVRVTLHLPRYIDVKPGSHAYLRFGHASWWESHPFSVAWTDHCPETKELPISEKEFCLVERKVSSSVSFIIGAQNGMTRRLYNRAIAAADQDRTLSMKANFEGPYGGHHDLSSYGHVVLFAGGTGITHQISFLRPLIEGYNNGTVATRRITLIWVVRDYECLEWVKPWMNEILRLPNRKNILFIKLFITRPKNASEITSASSTVQMFPGRPNIRTLLHREVAEQQGAMLVSVCSAGAMSDSVREGVREVQAAGTVLDFSHDLFMW